MSFCFCETKRNSSDEKSQPKKKFLFQFLAQRARFLTKKILEHQISFTTEFFRYNQTVKTKMKQKGDVMIESPSILASGSSVHSL